MTNLNQEPAIVEIGITEVDAEHHFQLRLLGGMQVAIDASERESAVRLLSQLCSYSEAHFATEQVFMRLHSYPGYQAHEREHGELLGELRDMLEAAKSAATDLSEWPQTVRRWLLAHINTADAAFGAWVRREAQKTEQT